MSCENVKNSNISNLSPPETAATCAVCSKTSAVYCPRCRLIGYCSHDHRLHHWDAHDKDCIAVNPVKIGRIGNGNNKQRALISRNDFKSGSIIFFDMPIIRGPDDNLLSPDAVRYCFLTSSKQRSTCITCCSIVLDGRACAKCQWPVCSEKCSQDPLHAHSECTIFQGKPETVFNVVKPAKFILILRCLLIKESNPKTWNSILALDTNPVFKQFEKYLDGDKSVTDNQLTRQRTTDIEILRDVMDHLRHFQLQKRFSRHLVSRIIQVLNWNAIPTELSSKKENMVLYPRITVGQHSCTPNAFWSIKGNYQLLCFARKNIKVEESLSLSRVSDEILLMRTATRQKHLREMNIFCHCDRCSDPQELGSHYSTVKCINFEFFDSVKGCIVGDLEPEHSADPETMWKCKNCDCSRSNKLIQNYMTRIQLELDEAKQLASGLKYKTLNLSKAKHLADQLGLEKVIAVIKHHEGRTLHKSHELLFQAKCFIIKHLSRGVAEVFTINVPIKDDIMKLLVDAATYVVELCDDCLLLLSTLLSGLSLQRGEIIYYKQFCMGILLPGEFKKHKQSNGVNLMEFLRAFEEAKLLRTQARFILSFYLENTEVSKMLEFMTLDEFLYTTLQKHLDEFVPALASASKLLLSSSSASAWPDVQFLCT